MSTLKNFRIWLGWWMWKHTGVSVLSMFCCMLLMVFAAMMPLARDEPFFHVLWLRVPIFVLGTVPLIAFMWADPYRMDVAKNWRRAVEEAVQILAGKTLSGKMSTRLQYLAKGAFLSKDAVELGQWITNWREWCRFSGEVDGLTKRQRELAIQINEKKEEIARLWKELAEA